MAIVLIKMKWKICALLECVVCALMNDTGSFITEKEISKRQKKNVNKKNKPKCKSMGKIIINNESANEMA